ncbi:MAG: hypothetical protein FWD25_13565 [Clostridia bacterium]|nr:hypothetical protein [Clostridia bacterium]
MQPNFANGPDMPIGLGMALAQNLGAMERFAKLPKEEQQRVIAGTHGIGSREEMQAYIGSLFQ